jgi:hypothetical protein
MNSSNCEYFTLREFALTYFPFCSNGAGVAIVASVKLYQLQHSRMASDEFALASCDFVMGSAILICGQRLLIAFAR